MPGSPAGRRTQCRPDELSPPGAHIKPGFSSHCLFAAQSAQCVDWSTHSPGSWNSSGGEPNVSAAGGMGGEHLVTNEQAGATPQERAWSRPPSGGSQRLQAVPWARARARRARSGRRRCFGALGWRSRPRARQPGPLTAECSRVDPLCGGPFYAFEDGAAGVHAGRVLCGGIGL
jgi:hypothetical protein